MGRSIERRFRPPDWGRWRSRHPRKSCNAGTFGRALTLPDVQQPAESHRPFLCRTDSRLHLALLGRPASFRLVVPKSRSSRFTSMQMDEFLSSQVQKTHTSVQIYTCIQIASASALAKIFPGHVQTHFMPFRSAKVVKTMEIFGKESPA